MSDKTTIERAFEIARSGEVADIKALRHRMNLEGREDFPTHMRGSPSLGRQLIAAIKAAGHA